MPRCSALGSELPQEAGGLQRRQWMATSSSEETGEGEEVKRVTLCVRESLDTTELEVNDGCPEDNCPPGLVDGDREQNSPPVTQVEAVKDLLSHLDDHKSIGPVGIHPRLMSELANDQSWITA
ncbi:hypothetical protein DUI87_16185 [Hirundo rustica rustica]|uniref:Uncharacterized protein n=1 Tax=Hirundo rustica rustica TaxID=333673 RepID=A0A3M0K0G2_HIRRU|nr:hypothetical protein DUI87_16185 [Hirundo rustica rustica]